MTLHYEGDSINGVLPIILSDLLEYGDEVGSRNGRVKEIINPQIVLKQPWRREVLCNGRGANVFAQIAETAWVLAGRNDVEWLSAYLPRAKDFSDDGETWRGGYGPRLRFWDNLPLGSRTAGQPGPIDQLAHVVDLLKQDPLSRRAVIAIYNPTVDTEPGKDIPCNDFLQFQSRLGKLHMTVTVRSNDVMWGWSGINAFEWSTLQEIVASMLGIGIGDLVFNIGSLHLYERHWAKARHIDADLTQHPRIPFDPDRLVRDVATLDTLLDRFFIWEGLCRKGEVTYEMLEDWEEPMFKGWAAAIAYYWTRRDEFIHHIGGTTLGVAAARVPASLLPEPVTASRTVTPARVAARPPRDAAAAFYDFVSDLHATKHKSYGDSWKKRGEMLSILANMARKVDRLGVGDEFDSSADTVIDLLVYSIKYLCWLRGEDDGPGRVNEWLRYLLQFDGPEASLTEEWVEKIRRDFDTYVDGLAANPNREASEKSNFVLSLARALTPVALDTWYLENEYRGADAD